MYEDILAETRYIQCVHSAGCPQLHREAPPRERSCGYQHPDPQVPRDGSTRGAGHRPRLRNHVEGSQAHAKQSAQFLALQANVASLSRVLHLSRWECTCGGRHGCAIAVGWEFDKLRRRVGCLQLLLGPPGRAITVQARVTSNGTEDVGWKRTGKGRRRTSTKYLGSRGSLALKTVPMHHSCGQRGKYLSPCACCHPNSSRSRR